MSALLSVVLLEDSAANRDVWSAVFMTLGLQPHASFGPYNLHSQQLQGNPQLNAWQRYLSEDSLLRGRHSSAYTSLFMRTRTQPELQQPPSDDIWWTRFASLIANCQPKRLSF